MFQSLGTAAHVGVEIGAVGVGQLAEKNLNPIVKPPHNDTGIGEEEDGTRGEHRRLFGRGGRGARLLAATDGETNRNTGHAAEKQR